MYRTSSVSSSSRSKESSSSGSRSSRSGASGSTRGRSPRRSRSRSPSPRGRRYRSPSSSRSSRRSPSPRRSSRVRSPSVGSRAGSEQACPRRSTGRRSCSPGWHSRSTGRHSPSRHSESSVEQNLRITVGNDRYGIDTPERKRISDRLGSPVDSLSDLDRDDLADGPIFSRGLSRPRSLERYPSCEENASSPFSMRHNEDSHSRDVFLHQSDYSMNYDHLQALPRETDRDGVLLRKSSYSSEDRGREPKRPRYDRDDRLSDMSIEPQGFLPGTRNYRKRSPSRSPSPPYLDFRELESARRKREEELSRNLSRELPGHGYMIPDRSNPLQSSEPRYLYRPDEAPAMPKKSILKKRVDDPSVQPEVFSNSSASVKEPPLITDHPPSQKRSSIAPFSSEVENFLKQFNKSAVAESTNKESQGSVHNWKLNSGQQQNTSPFEQNFGSFLKQKDYHESISEPEDRHNDFLLPHERASQDGSGFSRILGMMADSTCAQEKRRRGFPDIEDEEKFLYGDDEDDSSINSPATLKPTLSVVKEPESLKESSPPPANPSVKPGKSRPEYEKIHDLLKTIGLDIGVAEIGKLAVRTQERLHGKKASRSPDRHSITSHKLESRERRHSRSDTHSPESRQHHSLSPSGSFPPSKDIPSISNSEHTESITVGQNNPTPIPEQSVPPISLMPSAPPLPNLSSTSTSVSQYRVSRFSPFTATQLPQNYPSPTMPPPGYDAYGHYMAYAASGWPMYAAPQQADPTLSDVHGLVTLTVPPNPTRPNLRVIETVSTGKGTPDTKRDDSVLIQIPSATTYSKLSPQFSQPFHKSVKERISDERNRASQKLKVMEEREKLRSEQEARQKKLHYLKTELERLSKQQGEMLRKKRREKDGHKDPLLIEVNRLQENIMKEISQLKLHAEAAEKKQSELDKVAQILGINIFEKSRKQSSENKDSSEKNKSENAKGQERTSNSVKDLKTNDKPGCRSPKSTESHFQPSKQHSQETNIYDYYDTGNHWCKDCNTICGTMFDFFTHMHNKKHRQTLDPYNRPWALKTQTETKQDLTKRIDKILVPAKGSEFLIPVTGYYCQLCQEFFGDQISAEQHVKNNPHNEKYKKYVDENPLYEERRNIDRQAGLSVIQETERRLKRKLCEKQKEERDEKAVKVARKEERKSKEEPKNSKELGDGDNENESNKRKGVSNGQKCGIKLKLKKDDKEVEKKEGKKEEPPKESRMTSFGKFSWRKTERDEKNQGKDVTAPKEESCEESKDKESKSQSGKPNSKPIAIKLSGKTVIPHTSPWTPVVSTSSQAKIRPNLPAPMMVLRKSATATVSKPAPLNTFLSIKSSGASTKPLPVVKEGNPELVLPPDIISKAFGGEVVVLKGSQENATAPEQTEQPDHEAVSRAVEHAKAAEHAKATSAIAQEQAAKAQEQANVVAKAQAKARELAAVIKEQVTRLGIFERPNRRPPLLPLSAGPPLSVALPVPPAMAFPPPPAVPPKQATILADDMAPGVSEDDKNILAVPMCPHPLPPPTIFRDHVKKLEKKNSCLAAGNAKDLYDIFYNRSGRSPADSKSVNSDKTSDKIKSNPVERQKKTDLLADPKPSSKPVTQETLQNIHSTSDVSKIPLNDKTPETDDAEVEKLLAAYEENFKTGVERESKKISLSDAQSVLKYESNDFSVNAPETTDFKSDDDKELAVQLSVDRVALLEDVSKKPSELETIELAMQLPVSNASPLEELYKNSSVCEAAEVNSPDDDELTMQLSLNSGTKKPSELGTAEFALQLPESSVPSLDDFSNKPADLVTTDFKSDDDKELAMKLSENHVSKKPSELETAELAELAMQLPESNASPLEELHKNPSVCEEAVFRSLDDKESAMQLSQEHDNKKSSELETAEFAMQLPESSVPPLDDLTNKPTGLKTTDVKSPDNKELTVQLSESSVFPLDDFSNKTVDLETTDFKFPDDKELGLHMSEDHVALLKEHDVNKKLSEFKTAGLAMQLPESNTSLEEFCQNSLECRAAEYKSDDKEVALQLSEDQEALLKDVSKKPLGHEMAEFKFPGKKELIMQMAENETDFTAEDVGVASGTDISDELQDQQKMDKSKLNKISKSLEMKAYLTSLGERDVGGEHSEFAGHQFVVSQEHESRLFETQIDTPKGEGHTITEDKQLDDSSESTISMWVSKVHVQSPLAWEPASSSKVNKENPQIAMIDQSSNKESLLDLKWGNVGLERLKSAISDESPQTSEVQNIDPGLKPLNTDEFNNSCINNEQKLLTSSQQNDENCSVVGVPVSEEMSNECLVNVTMISSTLGKHEEISQHPLSCETKDSQAKGAETLGSMSSANDELRSSAELMFIKNNGCGPSESDLSLNDNAERGSVETYSTHFSSVQPEMVQEPLGALPTEISVEHLGEVALTFTDMNTGILDTSAAGDLDLNSTYSELNFDHSTTPSPKSGEIKPNDSPRLKPSLEIETINFSLGDIEVEREHLGILPSEILNEDIVGSPKLETISSISLGSNKTRELGIEQPTIEPEMIAFVELASGEEEDKFCSLVSDVIVPDIVSPASNGSTSGPSMSLIEMQDMPPISMVLQSDASRDSTSDMPPLSSDGKNVQCQATECKESFLLDLQKTSVEVGGSGDNELYIVKNEMQASARELNKTDEVENNDSRYEINSKLTSEVTESSAEYLLL
ncbi:zinc finger protein 318 isoform X2 [Podarcis muralis]